MIILHVARIKDNPCNGVHVVVPMHVATQAKSNTVALVNVNGFDLKLGKLQLAFPGAEGFPDKLEKPFDRPDLVVFHEVNNVENIALYKQLVKRGIPYVIVPHGELAAQALKKKWFKKKVAYLLFFNRFIRKAKGIQCLSQNESDAVKIKTSEKFIGTNGVTLSDATKVAYSEEGMKLVYVGRLEAEVKGLDLLITAVRDIMNFMAEHGVSVDIYGPDILGRRAHLERLIAEAGVGAFITLNDPVLGEEKTKAVLSHDVFIQTSRTEGMPMGILEAMAFGMPVIASVGTTLADVIRAADSGYYAGSSAEEIAAAIKTAFSDRENWKTKGENARKLVEDRFGWDTVTKETLKKYAAFIGNGK